MFVRVVCVFVCVCDCVRVCCVRAYPEHGDHIQMHGDALDVRVQIV